LGYLLLLFIFKSVKKSSFFSFGQFIFFIFYVSSHYNLCLSLCSNFFWFNIIMNWTNFTHRTYIVFTMKDYLSNLRDCWNVWISFFKGEINLYKSFLQNGPETAWYLNRVYWRNLRFSQQCCAFCNTLKAVSASETW